MSGFESTLESKVNSEVSHTSGAPFAQLHTDRVGRITPLYSGNGSVNPSSPVYVQLSLGVIQTVKTRFRGKNWRKNCFPSCEEVPPPKKNPAKTSDL